MKYLSLVLSLAVLAACSTTEKPTVPVSSLVDFADSLYTTHLDSGHIAGGSVLIARGGEVLLDKSYGMANLEFSVPMPEDASFEIGSVTKQFTAAAILRLAEDGKLSLDDDFTDYVDYDTKDREIPVRMLLNHTSGIKGYTEMEDIWNFVKTSYERDTLLRMVEKEEFLFEPGTSMSYNNSAYYILGLVIEKASGQTYEEYLEEQFFTPLEMGNTYYCETSKVVPNKAYGYGYTPDGLTQKAYIDHIWPYAAGSLCSTTKDLLTWTKALHSGQVLDDASYDLLITPESLADGTPLRYGMGLAHFNDNGFDRLSHGGGIPGFLTASRYYPDEDLTVISLVNTMGPNGAGFFADELTWQVLDKKKVPEMEMESGLSDLEGTYAGSADGREINMTISILSDAIVFSDGEGEPDTVRTYIGNQTWMDNNSIITIRDGKVYADQVYGYFVLEKQ